MQDVRKTVLASLPACKTMVTEIVARTHDVDHEVRTKWSCAVILFGLELPALLRARHVLTSQISAACHLWTHIKHHVGSTCGKQLEALHSLLCTMYTVHLRYWSKPRNCLKYVVYTLTCLQSLCLLFNTKICQANPSNTTRLRCSLRLHCLHLYML